MRRKKLHPKSVGNGRCDLILHSKHIRHFAVVTMRPKVRSVLCLNKLSRHAKTILGTPNTALKNINYSKCLRDLPNVLILAFDANAEVRAMTLSPLTCARALIISSARPSEKYSSPASWLMFANGNTAMEGVVFAAGRMTPSSPG